MLGCILRLESSECGITAQAPKAPSALEGLAQGSCWGCKGNFIPSVAHPHLPRFMEALRGNRPPTAVLGELEDNRLFGFVVYSQPHPHPPSEMKTADEMHCPLVSLPDRASWPPCEAPGIPQWREQVRPVFREQECGRHLVHSTQKQVPN